jgi:type II secretory pathway predicted ATPase ExeA
LTYGVREKKGFVVVSGEVGTGKTLLVRCLLDSLTCHKIAFAFVYNPVLKVSEFLAHLVNELGIPTKSTSKVELLSSLNNYLLARSRRGETTALIVDEAQLLSWELLEEIRLLTNLETPQFKLLQIVLVGQPELEEKLDSQELRQLKQRVFMRCRLKPLEAGEVGGYIRLRLQLAGANPRVAIFPDETILAAHQLSRGIPRLINSICENALIAGYGKQAPQITPAIALEVATDLRLEAIPPATPSNSAELQEVWKVLTVLVDRWDDRAKNSPQNLKTETGVQTE